MNLPRAVGFSVFRWPTFAGSLAGYLLLAPLALSQGSLTPPGAPAPTMKTLDQVEARTIVNLTNTPGNAGNSFVISQPGSYYLTGNITGVSGKNGILINSNNVSLDLNGFQLLGVSGSGFGIYDGGSNHGNAVIRNGTVRAWAQAGIDMSSSFDALMSDLIIADCLTYGMNVGDSCVMRDSLVRNNNGANIRSGPNANVVHCTAVSSFQNRGFSLGANSTITASSANSNSSDGIVVGANSIVTNCETFSNGGSGIDGSAGSVQITNCTCNQNQLGIYAGDDCSISHSKAATNSGLAGIAIASRSAVDSCVVSANKGRGIQVTGNSSTLVNNNVSGNGSGSGGFGFSAGIYISGGFHDRIDGNHVADNKGDGITIDSNGGTVQQHNLVIRNSCISNTAFQYRMSGIPGQGTAGDNDVGPIGSAASVSSPWANLIFF